MKFQIVLEIYCAFYPLKEKIKREKEKSKLKDFIL